MVAADAAEYSDGCGKGVVRGVAFGGGGVGGAGGWKSFRAPINSGANATSTLRVDEALGPATASRRPSVRTALNARSWRLGIERSRGRPPWRPRDSSNSQSPSAPLFSLSEDERRGDGGGLRWGGCESGRSGVRGFGRFGIGE